MGRVGKVIDVSRDLTARKSELDKLAQAQGLTVVFGGGGLVTFMTGEITFSNKGHKKQSVWGVWAAEQFLQGYLFALNKPEHLKEQLGQWKDEEDWDDDDDDDDKPVPAIPKVGPTKIMGDWD